MSKFSRIIAVAMIAIMLILAAPASLLALDRYSGNDRYATAVEISNSGWANGSDVVILCRGDVYADALAGVPLAYANNAPVLLTQPNSLPAVTKDEIGRLGATKVYILGGSAAVSLEVEEEVKALEIEVTRIGGPDRFATAAAIAALVAPEGAETVFLAYGPNFPDALAAASYAAISGSPVLLTGTDKLPEETAAALAALQPAKIFVVGGTAVISDAVFNELPNAERIYGADRYGTAVALAERFIPDAAFMYVATGLDVSGGADAITGAALAAKEGTGILLVGNFLSPVVAEFLGKGIQDAVVLGGGAAIAPDVAQAVEDALYGYRGIIDEIISGGIVDVNNAISNSTHDEYAVLSELGADGSVAVNIKNGGIQVTNVYTDIVQILIDALNANKDKVASITAGTGTINLTGEAISAEAIKAFVKGSGLTGSTGGEIMGSDPISVLLGQTLSATVTDINGKTYVYNVTFQPYVDQVIVDGIISGGIVDVNTAITANGDYAELGALDAATGTVSVVINNGSILVTEVYTDIVQILIDALNANNDKVASISAGTSTIDLTGEAISAEAIKAFVKGSGLKGSAGGEILGSDSISLLVGQTLSATVTDINGANYVYNVTFKPYVDQVIVDGIISGGIVDVNTAITANGDYAELGALDTATSTVFVVINNGSTLVTEVYTDIVQVLIDALNANKDKVASIAAGTSTINLTGEAISAEAIKALVKGSGLEGSGADGEILGGDPISLLVGQTLTATVTDVIGGEYTYSVTFQIVE